MSGVVHELRYTLDGRPYAWKRTNEVDGRRVTPAGMREAKAAHAILALKARQEWARVSRRPWPMDGEFELEVRAFMPHRGSLPDWDNLGKLVSDALNRIVYADDVQVTDGWVRRRIDRERPRVEVVCRRFENQAEREASTEMDFESSPLTQTSGRKP